MARTSFALIALLLAGPVAFADDAPAAAARAKALAPFLEAETIAVVRIDLTRLDIPAVSKQLTALGVLDEKATTFLATAAKEGSAAFAKAGGKEVFALVNPADALTGLPLLVVPLTEGADAKGLEAILKPALPESASFETHAGFLLVGGKETLARLKSAQPAARPELSPALEAAGDTAVQVLFLPSKDLRKIASELLPTLPKEAGGGSSKVLTEGLRWAALGVNGSPKASLRLVVQASDADAAKTLRPVLVQAFRGSVVKEMEQALKDLALGGAAKKLSAVMPRTYAMFAKEDVLRVEKDRLVLSLDDLTPMLEELAKLSGTAGPPVERAQSIKNLRQIGIAFHNYHDANGHFPGPAIASKAGKPLLSWRVALLPYLEQGQLYAEFKQDEPWDSEHNKKLLARMPKIYAPTGGGKAKPGYTFYQVFVGKDAPFQVGKQRRFTDIPDGTSNTILAVEGGEAVPWTKPDDLPYDAKKPLPKLGGLFGGNFHVLMFDGSVRFIVRNKVSEQTLRAAITPSGGEVLGKDWE